MANIFNIGSVALYTKNALGEYEYQTIYDLFDFLGEDGTINLDHNISFGASFDIIGDHILIGCPYEDPLFDDLAVTNNREIGAVYVFDINTKTLIQKIVPDNTPAEWDDNGVTRHVLRQHNFGYSLCAGTDYFIVGAPGYTNRTSQTYTGTGRAYMYKWNSTNSEYELSYTFVPNTEIEKNRFGNYISCHGDNVIIGSAPSVNNEQAGYVRYFVINEDRDGITTDLTILNTHISTNCDMTVNDNKIAIGTPYNDTVKVYEITQDSIKQSHTVSDALTTSFDFGSQVLFDEKHLVVGCPNGYSKLGITLRLTNIGEEYVIL